MIWLYILHTLLLIFLFCIDSATMYWFDQPVLQSVTAYFFASLMHKGRTPFQIGAIALIGIESCIIHGRFGVYLLPILPCYLIYQSLTRSITIARGVPYLLFTISLLVNWFMIDPFITGGQPAMACTGMKIFANLLLLSILN